MNLFTFFFSLQYNKTMLFLCFEACTQSAFISSKVSNKSEVAPSILIIHYGKCGRYFYDERCLCPISRQPDVFLA